MVSIITIYWTERSLSAETWIHGQDEVRQNESLPSGEQRLEIDNILAFSPRSVTPISAGRCEGCP